MSLLNKAITIKKLYYITLFSFILSVQANARHIIGGDMYYECLGNDRYRITMVVYRDCSSNSGAQFDSAPNSLPGTVTVYRSDSNNPYIRTILLPEPEISFVEAELSNPCLIVPPNVCVEKGVYTFEVTLPNSIFSYQIVYQRCCRNNTITNIRRPGDTGATYTIEITPQAQDMCNSSIQFNNFPPIVICNDEPLRFEHSAFDPDNDTTGNIIYEFCTPFEGGGLGGSTQPGDPNSFNGVAPNPDAPPPYAEVDFIGGDFTRNSPMGGDPVIQIDRETGLITGTPTSLGQYVVGVCATELDSSGNILSVIRRDFQFNVASCDTRVFAEIEADTEEDGAFVINSCGSSTVNFINRSYQEEFIERYRWEFDMNGNIENYSSRNPSVTFPGLGTYKGTMYLNEGTSCSDTAEIEVNIYGGITNSFDYSYDTCVAGPISVTGFDSTGNDRITDRVWYFTSNDSSLGQTASFEYRQAGIQAIRYIVTDNVGCTAESIRNVPYFPIPNEIIVTTEQQNNCSPALIFFDNMSYPLDERYDVLWEFGDGESSTEISPTHVYEEPGSYNVSIRIESPIGCIYEGELDQAVQTIPSPVAGFTYEPQDLNQFNKQVNFIDNSKDADQWDWIFPNDQESTVKNPTFNFPDTGIYSVTQIVTHSNGCKDTLTKILDIEPKATFFLPNAFTPNGDGRNDEFRGAGDLIGVTDFQMLIFNRWGEMVFQTQDPQEGWNGRKNNTGLLLPQDVYVVKVSYIGPRGNRVETEGFATLIR